MRKGKVQGEIGIFFEDKKVENLSDGKCRCPETMSRGRRRRKGRTPDSPM